MGTLNRNFRLCSCPNQHQLMPGEICDICQGIIAEEQTTEPDTFQQGGIYTFDFFNDLENYLETKIHAA